MTNERQKFETVDTCKMYELQIGTKGDVRILMYGKVFRRFTGYNKHSDAKRWFKNIKEILG